MHTLSTIICSLSALFASHDVVRDSLYSHEYMVSLLMAGAATAPSQLPAGGVHPKQRAKAANGMQEALFYSTS